ncbi:MAG: heme NO-binding domain-containing protein [Actinomycetota bacterium]|nr:heme NO-binding domain-containing protein [Actinomycetota bacterium]
MYGLVNKAIEDLAISAGGEETWQRIKDEAGVDVVAFVSMDAYDDDLTYRLVGAASRVLGMPAEEILKSFGRHWVLYTAREGYGPLLERAGSSLGEFLANLDALHTRVGLTMPALRPPSFQVDVVDDATFLVRYYSERGGLSPMVVGLLEGVGKRFGHEVVVTHSAHRSEVLDHDEFLLRIVGEVSLEAVAEAVQPA